MTYAEAIAKLEEIDAKLVREGDPDLRDLPITEGQRKWLLHLGLSRALEVLREADRALTPLDLGPLCPSCGTSPAAPKRWLAIHGRPSMQKVCAACVLKWIAEGS